MKKKYVLQDLYKFEKGNLHVKAPAPLLKLLEAEALKDFGNNKSRTVINILAKHYNILASGSE